MKCVHPLTPDVEATLRAHLKHSPTLRVRHRAHAVLLHAKGYALQSLAEIFAVHRDTIQHWLINWERAGCAGLADMLRPGRPPTLSPQEEADVLHILQNQRGPRQAVLAQIRASLGKDVSQSWLTRFVKKHQPVGTAAAEGDIHLHGAMASKEATSWIP